MDFVFCFLQLFTVLGDDVEVHRWKFQKVIPNYHYATSAYLDTPQYQCPAFQLRNDVYEWFCWSPSQILRYYPR